MGSINKVIGKWRLATFPLLPLTFGASEVVFEHVGITCKAVTFAVIVYQNRQLKAARPIFNTSARRLWLQKDSEPFGVTMKISNRCLRLKQSKTHVLYVYYSHGSSYLLCSVSKGLLRMFLHSLFLYSPHPVCKRILLTLLWNVFRTQLLVITTRSKPPPISPGFLQ